MAGPTLEYDSTTTSTDVQTPSRFQVAMEDERGRWLRRRFIGYCILGLTINGLSLLFIGANDESSQLWLIGYLLGLMGVLSAAMVYAWRSPPQAKVMMRIAIWLYILTSVASLATNRIAVELEYTHEADASEFAASLEEESAAARRERAADEAMSPEDALAAVQDQLAGAGGLLDLAEQTLARAGDDATVVDWHAQVRDLNNETQALRNEIDQIGGSATQITVTPTGARARGAVSAGGPSSGLRAGIAALWSLFAFLFFNHLISCLIIPWTFRESLFAGLVVFNAFVLIVIVDIMFSNLPWWAAVLFIVGGLLALVPGSLWCFWRYTRFPKVFRTRYEADRYKQLSKDLSGARQIHESVLPPQKNYGAVRLNYVYEPMSQIGGDLLYVREAEGEDGCVSAVLLDVTGHGVAAALTVNRLLGELDRIYGENPHVSPGKVLSGLNHYVHLTLVRHGVFVTGLALRLEPGNDDGNLTYANAGHPPAFACRNGDCERLEPTTYMLGVMDDDDFDSNEQSYHLDPGDAVLFYTDGAAEARDNRGRQIGTKGLEKLFNAMTVDRAPADWPKVVLGHVAQHRNRPPDDDTIVASMYRAEEGK